MSIYLHAVVDVLTVIVVCHSKQSLRKLIESQYVGLECVCILAFIKRGSISCLWMQDTSYVNIPQETGLIDVWRTRPQTSLIKTASQFDFYKRVVVHISKCDIIVPSVSLPMSSSLGLMSGIWEIGSETNVACRLQGANISAQSPVAVRFN